MDGRTLPALEDVHPKWNGYSVGRFDQDTLIVDSIGFDERSWLDKFGYPHSDQMRLEERYRRVDANTLELTMTVTDPVVYTKPWVSDTKRFTLNREKAKSWDEQIYCVPAEEFACHRLIESGNGSSRNTFDSLPDWPRTDARAGSPDTVCRMRPAGESG